MSDPLDKTEELMASLEGAMELLAGYSPASTALAAPPLPSLLSECEALCAETPPEMFRSVHHFACTGGTLISKCIGALPNTVLLSEIDPLSELHLIKKSRPFFPTDILADFKYNPRVSSPELLTEVFMAGIRRMAELLAERGQYQVIRDHAHSQFCSAVDPATRPTLHEILSQNTLTRAIVTVRHPLDSFLSLNAHGWPLFSPATLEEYSRRYHLFLDRHAALPSFRYEDFVEDPETVLLEMADALALPFDPAALNLTSVMLLSGDSGRSGNRISKRDRRAIPDGIASQAEESKTYKSLCQRLAYET